MRMRLAFFIHIGRICTLLCKENTDALITAINFDRCNPFAPGLKHPKYAAFVVYARVYSILGIFRNGSISQIMKSIVSFNAIFMVNKVNRPIFGYIKPSQSMSGVKFIKNSYAYIWVWLASRNIAHMNPAGRPDFPSKYSSFWIVMQRIKKLLVCKFHAVPLLVSSLYKNNGNLYRNRGLGATLAVDRVL